MTPSVVSIVAEFEELGPQPFTLIGTHPVPPQNRRLAEARNEQLRAIAQFIRKENQPTIVAGDLNITSYSPHCHELLRRANLRDSRQGIGVQASWSPRIPLLLGSDHRPVIVEVR